MWMALGAKLGRAGVRPVDADGDRSMLREAVRAHDKNYRNFKEVSAAIYRDDVTPSGWPVDSESAHRFARDTQVSGAAIYSYDGWFDLDSKNGEAVMDLMSNLHMEGDTICMVTHDPRFAQYADRTVQLFDGQIVEESGVAATA